MYNNQFNLTPGAWLFSFCTIIGPVQVNRGVGLTNSTHKMKNLKALLQGWIATVFANLGKVLFGATVLGIIGWLGGIFHVYQTTWLFVKILLQSQTPIWATLSLLALSSYWLYYVTFQRESSSRSPSQKWGLLIKAGGVKWLVSHSSGIVVHVKETPYCPKHDLQLAEEGKYFVCVRGDFKISVDQVIKSLPTINIEIEKAVREL